MTTDNLIRKINNGDNKAFRELYGNDPSELKRNGKRYTGLLKKFQSEFGKKDVDFFTSPGRTEIGGNHTDHNYGRVLAGAVNLDNVCIAGNNNTNVIRIISEGYPQFEVDLKDLKPVKSEKYTSAALVRGICARFKELGHEIGGFDACIDGGVPKGSGLSSSASFEVLIGAILSELFNIFYNCAWTFPAFTDAEAVAVKGFVDAGINLFVAGQDIGWDIMSGASGSHGTPETQDLYTNYLKASFIDDGNNTNNKLIAKVDDPIYGTTATSNIFDIYGGYMYPDQISPLADATTIFYYNTTLTKIGAIRSMKGSAKVVYFGVGLEMVQNTEVRNDILNKTYDYFMEGVGTGEKTGVAGSYLGTCFPNPAHDFTTIRLSNIDREMVVEIVDINGKTVMSKQVMPGTKQIGMNTAILPAGLYLCRIIDQGSVLETKKIQVIH